MDDLISRQAAIDAIRKDVMGGLNYESILKRLPSVQQDVPDTNVGGKTCKTCHLWEDGEINIACPWGSNYEHYEDDYCSLWEKQN